MGKRDIKALRVGAVVLAGLFAAGAGGGPAARAQQGTAPAGTNIGAPSPAKPGESTPATGAQAASEPKQEAEVQKPAAPISERQKKLAADTDRLLALAKELKQQVDKTNKNVLSVSVVKKAEEIEKLARSVKTEMK